MADEIIVRLKITSVHITPEEITEKLGISCDNSWRLGDKRKKTIIEEKENGWVLDSGLSRSASLENHIDVLLKRLSPHAVTIRLLSQKSKVELSCVCYAATPPALNFSSGIIKRLDELGASLDIDLYL